GLVGMGRPAVGVGGAVVAGAPKIGADNLTPPSAGLGREPQDLAFTGAPTGLRIGDGNVFREHSEVHRGTQPDTSTEIGNGNFVMSHAHVAHNCRVGDGTIIATGAALGGHVVVEDGAFISGNCVVHQHCRVGRLSILRR